MGPALRGGATPVFLVVSATRHGRTIIAVLLNDPHVYPDAKRLLDLGVATRV